MPEPGYLLNLGETPYLEAWELQRALAGAVSQGAIPDTVVMLEHPPVRRQNTDSRVLGSNDLCRHLHGALKDPIERDLGDERRSGRLELLQAVLCRRRLANRWYGHTEKISRGATGHV